MVRTQVYLTDSQRAELTMIAKESGEKQSVIIRRAINEYIEHSSHERRLAILKEAAGMWKDRTELPDFEDIRKSWDRA